MAADATVPCGTLLGAITADGDEAFDADAFRRAHDRPAAVARAPQRPVAPPAAAVAAAPTSRRAVAPAARALAQQLGIETDAIPGSGPGGRVTREDVEAWAAARQRLTAAADGVRLEVLRDGQGPPLALLPGFGSDVSAFAAQARALAATHAVLGINPRGVGASDAPPLEVYEVASAAADVAAVCGAPAHIVGASLGAATAIELALRYPERVRTLTLITPFVSASPRLLSVLDSWCRIAAESRAETLARALLPWLFSERLLADAGARERVVRGLAASAAAVPAATLSRAASGVRQWSGSRQGDLAQIRVPTLVVVAGADLLTPDGQAVAASIPGARTVVVAGAGHAVMIEAADQVTAAILDNL
ncbi:MAG TPA: alpha/beta fold hydrolase [Candidatus Dormibacteraeota bacterium]|nr:alpha/beta fold hydrolase [Candidatus Dormibacteraeota bacterium]